MINIHCLLCSLDVGDLEANKVEPNLQNLVCSESQGETMIIIVVTFFALHHDSAADC